MATAMAKWPPGRVGPAPGGWATWTASVQGGFRRHRLPGALRPGATVRTGGGPGAGRDYGPPVTTNGCLIGLLTVAALAGAGSGAVGQEAPPAEGTPGTTPAGWVADTRPWTLLPPPIRRTPVPDRFGFSTDQDEPTL